MTFAASANCVCFMGGTPVFTDIDANTLLIDPEQVARNITPKTKAIIGVDYAGQPCDWDALRKLGFWVCKLCRFGNNETTSLFLPDCL